MDHRVEFVEICSSWSLKLLRFTEGEFEGTTKHEEIDLYHLQRISNMAPPRMGRCKQMRDLDVTKRLVFLLGGNASVLRDEMGL